MTKVNPFARARIRYWCAECEREINWFDEKRCRCCGPVERINALAEEEAEYWTKELKIGSDRNWGAHWVYAECADIIMENQ